MSFLGFGGSSSEPEWDRDAVKNYSDSLKQDIVDKASSGNVEELIALSSNRGSVDGDSEQGISRDNFAYFIFQQARDRYGRARKKTNLLEEDLEREMGKLEDIDRKFASIEKKKGDSRELDREAERELEKEKSSIEELKEKFPEREAEIKNLIEESEKLLEVAIKVARGSGCEKTIKDYLGKIEKIRNYNIFSDLEIEEEDLEKFAERSEEIAEKRESGDEKSQEIAEEVEEAEKKFVSDEQAIRNLPEP